MYNIFLDSNILYQDCYFSNKSNKLILEYCKSGLLKIFISNIVILELRKQYENQLIKSYNDYENSISNLNKLNVPIVKKKIKTVENHLKSFDAFYSKLNKIRNFKILDYKYEFLDDIVNRAVYKLKPFDHNKTELKDALIWKTYSTYAEENHLNNCILLTNNTSDFCDKNDKKIIHKDLLKDSEKFEVINASYHFIKSYASQIETPEYTFKKYIEAINISNEYVNQIIKEHFEKDINKAIESKLEKLHPSEFIEGIRYDFDIHFRKTYLDILDCHYVDYEIINNMAIIDGCVVVECDVEILDYNFIREDENDSYLSTGEDTFIFDVYFNFNFYNNESFDEFEINFIEVNTIN